MMVNDGINNGINNDEAIEIVDLLIKSMGCSIVMLVYQRVMSTLD